MMLPGLFARAILACNVLTAAVQAAEHVSRKIQPKVFIISMYEDEATPWFENLPATGLGDLAARRVATPGLSMLSPHVHCTADGAVCQVTTGMGLPNAAATMMAVALSASLDLSRAYLLVAGVAGVHPARATLGSVALARYALQVDLQYELDAREMPARFPTGYFAFGTDAPGLAPATAYGTEVFELNAALRDAALALAARAALADSAGAEELRGRFAAAGTGFAAAAQPPGVVACDVASSNVFWSGNMLGEAVEKVTGVWLNGTGRYCMTAQEDNATLEVLVRMAIEGLVDFSRVILMRTGSDFDRPPPGTSALENLRGPAPGYKLALANIYNAGVEIVKDIIDKWECTYKKGLTPPNYVGDNLGSLPGHPAFGLGSQTDGKGFLPGGKSAERKGGSRKRAVNSRASRASRAFR